MLSKLLAFLGVAIGLCVLLVAMAIMNGFDKEISSKLFTMNYPLTLSSKLGYGVDRGLLKQLRKDFPKYRFSPFISTQAIVKNGSTLNGIVLFGVSFEDEFRINPVLKKVLITPPSPRYPLVLGSGLYEDLRLKKGRKLTLLFSDFSASGLALVPKMKRFEVAGYFKSGLAAYDKAYAYTSLAALGRVLGYKGVVDGIHVLSPHPFKDKEKLIKYLGPNYRVYGWWEQNGNFFSALALEKRALFIVLMLIILIASLNIVSSLLMIVMNRRQEIALLLALGASKTQIKQSFFSLGFFIGGCGILAGTLLAFLALFVLGHFDIIHLPADVYGDSKLPLDLSITDFVLTLVGSVVIVAVSSYYPAMKATKTNILTVLRNE